MKRFFLLFFLAWVVAAPALADSEFPSTDNSLKLTTDQEFRKTFNPHAILSLVSPYDTVVVVTKEKTTQTIDEIYDGFAERLSDGQSCLGRMLLTVDGHQAATFVMEGLFPPEGEPTHQTVMSIVNHDDHSYTFMVHYPLEDEEGGLELAHELLSGISFLGKVGEKS